MQNSNLKILMRKLFPIFAILILVFSFFGNVLAGTLSVKVVDEQNKPQEGAKVILKTRDPNSTFLPTPDTTGAQGNATFRDVPNGKYQVSAEKQIGNVKYSGTQDIEVPRQTSIELQIKPATTGTTGTSTGLDFLQRPVGSIVQREQPGEAEPTPLAVRLKDDEKLKNIWKTLLALSNIVVVLILLAVAFATIFHIQVDTYGIKKVLPGLVAGIILANLSFLLTRLIVDFATVLGATFINAVGGEDAFLNKLVEGMFFHHGTLLGAYEGSSITIGAFIATVGFFGLALLPGPILLGIILIAVILVAIPSILFLILAFLLYIRIYVIYFLIAVSPVAFLTMAFAPTQSMFRQWWSHFLRWTFMAPVVFFFLWIAVKLTEATRPEDVSIGIYILGLVMLYLAIQVPFKLGGAVMGVWGGFGKKAAVLAGSKAWTYGNALLERGGRQSPRSLLQGWTERQHKMDEHFRTLRAAESEEKFTQLLGSGEVGLFKMMTNKEARQAAKEQASIRTRGLRREQYRKDLAPYADRPDELLSYVKGNQRYQNDDARSVVAEILSKSYGSSSKQIFDEASKIGNKNDVGALLKQVLLPTLHGQRSNKQYDKALAMLLAQMDIEKFKDKDFADMQFKDLADTDKDKLKDNLVSLGMSGYEIERMSPEAQKSFDRFFEGAGIDWQELAKGAKGESGAGGAGSTVAPPPEFKVRADPAAVLNAEIVEAARAIWQTQSLPSNIEKQVKIAIQSNELRATIREHVALEFEGLSEVQTAIRGINPNEVSMQKIVEVVNKSALPAQRGETDKILLRLQSQPIDQTLKVIQDNPYDKYKTPTLATANKSDLDNYAKTIEQSVPKLNNWHVVNSAAKLNIQKEIVAAIKDFAPTGVPDLLQLEKEIKDPQGTQMALKKLGEMVEGYRKIKV